MVSDTLVVDHPQAQAVVIALHGLGADAANLQPLAQQFQAHGMRLRFVFPNAPLRPVTINQGMRMRAWYDILGLSNANQLDQAAFDESVAAIQQLLDEQIQQGMPSEKIILLGFSQGGAVATAAALGYSKPLGSLLALSTYMPAPEQLAVKQDSCQQQLPIFMAHGQWDPVLPMLLAEQARETLQSWGYQVDWHTYPMGHEIAPQEIADISQVFQTVLSRPVVL